MERARTGRAGAEPDSPLPPDPPGREDVISDGPGPAGPTAPAAGEKRTARAAGDNPPLPSDPAGREDVIGDGG